MSVPPNNISDYQVTRWCFTYFVPVQQDSTPSPFDISDPASHSLRYWVCQLERAPDTGRLHYQGYLHFTRSVRMSYVKRLPCFDQTVHLEVARGSVASNVAYCTKEDTRLAGPWSYGEVPEEQRSRVDLIEFREAARQRVVTTKRDIIEEFPMVLAKYPKFVDTVLDVYNDLSSIEFRPKYVFWVHGSPGTGKSRLAREYFSRISVPYYDLSLGTGTQGSVWFDGLGDEPALLVDDLQENQLSNGLLLRLLDRFPCRLQQKGGMRNHYFTYVFITSNLSPIYFPGLERGAVRRRARCILSVIASPLTHVSWKDEAGGFPETDEQVTLLREIVLSWPLYSACTEASVWKVSD